MIKMLTNVNKCSQILTNLYKCYQLLTTVSMLTNDLVLKNVNYYC